MMNFHSLLENLKSLLMFIFFKLSRKISFTSVRSSSFLRPVFIPDGFQCLRREIRLDDFNVSSIKT